jgi:molecular chaperone DnaJ
MAKRDYYEVLGISKNVTQDEIKKAYRTLAKTHHPDRGGDETVFKEIVEAYEILSDETKRAEYDRFGHGGPNASNGGYDPMEDFFRKAGFRPFNNGPQVIKGQDLYLTIKLTLEEVFTGVNKKFLYKRNTTCSPCQGKGGTGTKSCSACGGSGNITEIMNTPYGQIRRVSPCHVCGGIGSSYDVECKVCNGRGVNLEDDNIDIDIPHGVLDNMRMVVEGKGHGVKNGIPGDLIISIMELPHSNYVRNGNDLKMNLKLTYSQLILGDKVEISVIEGAKIRLNINEYTGVGETLRVLGKGMKQMGSDARGDLLLITELDIPKKLNEDQLKLVRELKKFEDKVASQETK